MADPRTAKLAGTVLWDDGTPFEGYAVVDFVLPDDAGSNEWPTVFRLAGDSSRAVPVRLPEIAVVPISSGEYDQDVDLFFNADMTPHNSRYKITFYDRTLKFIGGPTSLFAVTVDPTTPPTVTLPSPVVPT